MIKKKVNKVCSECLNFCKQRNDKKIICCPKFSKKGDDMLSRTDKELTMRFSVPVTKETIGFLRRASENGVFINDSGYGEEEYIMGEVVSVAYKMKGDFNNFVPILELFNNHYILDDKPQFILTDIEDK